MCVSGTKHRKHDNPYLYRPAPLQRAPHFPKSSVRAPALRRGKGHTEREGLVRFMPTLVAVGNVGEDIVDEDVVCGLDVEAADGVRGVDAHRFVRAVGAASEARL